MADNVTLPASVGTFIAAADEISAGVYVQRVKVTFGVDGAASDVSSSNRLPVTLGLTDSELRATPVPVSGTFWQATQPVSGTITANAGTGTFATSLAALPPLATGSNVIGGVTQSGTWNVGVTGSVAVTGTFWQATQPVSGTVTANAGSGTFAISATALPLPVGAATETTLAAINTKTPALGQATMANSEPVVIASNQSEIPVSIADVSATGNITTQNLVPAGAATAGSAVELILSGRSGVTIQVVGTYTGALSLQGTLDGTNWVTFGGTPLLNINTAALSATIASATQGIFQTEASAFTRIRVTALAAVTGTATVTVRATEIASVVSIDAALPAGANAIGAVTQSGTWTVQPGNTANTTAWLANPSTPAGATVEASSAKTATGNSASAITNANAKGAHFFINVTAVSGTTPTLTVAVQVQDPVSLTWVQIPGAITASITANGITMLTVAPGIVETANSKISNAIPRTYRLAWVIGGTTPSFTFSVGAQYIL